jgi:hypothetical protein
MNPDNHSRDEVLRHLLVATADAAPTPTRPTWRLAVASVSAFALAGVLTGGTLATVGATPIGTGQVDAPVQITTPPFLDDDVSILGAPIYATGRQPATFDLGVAPEGANGLAIAIYCLDVGEYHVELDGEFTFGTTCTPEPGEPSTGGGGTVIVFDGDPPRELFVDLTSGDYAVWAAWVYKPAPAEPSSTQQAALADGVVTREEYEAGFDRYVACMAALGFPVSQTGEDLEIIWYTIPGNAGNSGPANRCYEAEYQLVDAEWQAAHPQKSAEQMAAFVDGVVSRAEYLAAFDRFVDCVTPLGITVGGFDRDDEVLDYTVDASAAQPGESNRCYRFEFFDIEMAWRASVGSE